jgi:DNA-binding FrmR family transcriptional regulator
MSSGIPPSPERHAHPQSAATIARLARVEGHVKGIRRMAVEGSPCPQLLLQIAAARAALHKVGQLVLEDHLERCVLGAGPEELGTLLPELKEALANFAR